jgi:hypothetical protein
VFRIDPFFGSATQRIVSIPSTYRQKVKQSAKNAQEKVPPSKKEEKTRAEWRCEGLLGEARF